jgi:uncharacterized protein
MAIRFRSTALAIGAALAFVSGPTLADPALWAVRSNGSTVYLFGTIHAIDPSKVWRTPALDSAFGDSSELWLEVPLPVTSKGSPQPVTPEETQQIVQLVVRLGTTRDGPPLSSRLTTAEAAKLTTLLPPMPKGAVDRMRPWLVAPLVSGALDSRLGLQATAGADLTLDQDAVARGMPVHGFETMEQQLHFFADLSPDEELDFLRQTIAGARRDKAVTRTLERAWLAGDDKVLARIVVGEMKKESPLAYRRLVADRNQRWLPEIEAMLKTPAVRFVAVGDGHLIGPDGLVALLRRDGWQVDRVQ